MYMFKLNGRCDSIERWLSHEGKRFLKQHFFFLLSHSSVLHLVSHQQDARSGEEPSLDTALLVPPSWIPLHLELSETSLCCCISSFCMVVTKYLAQKRKERHIPAVLEPTGLSLWGAYGGTSTFLLGFGKHF